MKRNFFLQLLFVIMPMTTLAQSWIWGKSAEGGLGSAEGYGLATDNNGNIYQCGFYNAVTITFDSITFHTNSSTGNVYEIFLVKYDPSGNLLWSRSLGSAGDDAAYSVVTDQSNSVYVVGYFQPPGFTFGSSSLSSAGYGDLFLVKYDSAGNELWGRSAGGESGDLGYCVKLDNAGNIYIAGSFSSTSITFGTTTLNNTYPGRTDVYVVKYDPNGNVIWANKAGGPNSDEGFSLAVASGGGVYLCGSFEGPNITFGTVTLTSNGLSDLFVTKYDANGNVIWAKSAGGNSYDAAKCIAIDETGSIYITGWFYSAAVTFPTTTLINSDASGIYPDALMVKYDTSGNEVWAMSVGGTQEETGFNCATSIGSIYFVGSYQSASIMFDVDTFSIPPQCSEAWYILQCDHNGNGLSAASVNTGCSNGNTGYGAVACSANGDTYFGGAFKADSLIFGGDTLRITFSGGSHNSFVAKYSGIPTSSGEIYPQLVASVYPNPTNDVAHLKFNWSSRTTANLEVMDMFGKVIYRDVFNGQYYILDLSEKSSGVYYYRVFSGNETYSGIILRQ